MVALHPLVEVGALDADRGGVADPWVPARQRCSGCHTLRAGTQGTGNRSRPVQGPNLDQRIESFDDVIFAIRNGGFSGAIMPQNIVTGHEADEVAKFVSKYAGSEGPDDRPAAGSGSP